MDAGALRQRLLRHGPLLLALLAVLVWRVEQTRGLVLPAWVDSVHHTLAVRLILERGALPDDWGPYLPEVPFYYHFGFHLSAALLAKLTGLEGVRLGQAVLWAGHLWQVLAALGVWVLARALWPQEARALQALLLVGFVTQMPAYYVAWGRYTLLAGMALLASLMAAACARRALASVLLLALLAVTHYYAFALGLGFLLALGACERGRERLRPLLVALGGTLLAAPWLWRVWTWTRAFSRGGPGFSGAPASSMASAAWSLGPLRNELLLALAALGLVLLGRRLLRPSDAPERSARQWALVLWTLGLLALLLPLHVGPFRPDHAAIVLFLPAALLAAFALDALRAPRGLLLLVALVAWGLVETRRLVPANTVLADAEDVAAIDWIATHTPERAVFLLDAEPWMGLWRGKDGGFWITPLTGRQTVPPPVAHGWGAPLLSDLVRGQAQRLYELQRLPAPEACWQLERLMQESGAAYYYSHREWAEACPGLHRLPVPASGVRLYTKEPLARTLLP